eukprot:TRINITY_DN32334_c0_g1_i1.p1 TRINITY_DN32334_c0_g1~~TRINITY_DN32334_c0_g1_i1.p1  ORF type:complete len:123 (-),score=24.16 TRINITY_DN32334_c0_g1_i1:94-462(-)
MGKNKSSEGRKRSAPPPIEDFLWECTICTYKNNPEAFKCIMCGVSKGTSTRKSRINPDILQYKFSRHFFPHTSTKTRAIPVLESPLQVWKNQLKDPLRLTRRSPPKAKKTQTTKARYTIRKH